MSAISNYLENKLIDATLRGTAYISPSKVYLALYTANPNEDNSGAEVTGGSYVRKEITFGAASNGASSNSAEVLYPVATANWGTITHIGIFDASTAGNLLYYGALTNSKIIQTNDQLKVNAGDITVTLA
jgi:hypothetical protein